MLAIQVVSTFPGEQTQVSYPNFLSYLSSSAKWRCYEKKIFSAPAYPAMCTESSNVHDFFEKACIMVHGGGWRGVILVGFWPSASTQLKSLHLIIETNSCLFICKIMSFQ